MQMSCAFLKIRKKEKQSCPSIQNPDHNDIDLEWIGLDRVTITSITFGAIDIGIMAP